MARSDGWEPLNKAGSGSSKIAPPRKTNGEWAPIRNESPLSTTLNPSKSAEGDIGKNGGIVSDATLGVKVVISPESLVKPARITISPVATLPTLLETPTPKGIRIIEGPIFDLGPSGLSFKKPIQVSVSPSLEFREYLKKGAELEVGYWNGKIWQPVSESWNDDKGIIYFKTDHFSAFVTIATIIGVGVAGGAAVLWRADEWKRPWQFITPKSPEVIRHAKAVRLPDPDRLNTKGSTSLNLKSFVNRPGYFDPTWKSWWPRILVPSGETMISRGDADCFGATNYVASVLLAKNNPNFTDFICVSGSATNKKGERGLHGWIEIRIKGKVYVVDTLNTGNLCLIPKKIAYAKDKLKPKYQWTHLENSKKRYVGWGEKTETKKTKPATDADGYAWSYSGSAQDLKDYKTKEFSCNIMRRAIFWMA